MVCTFQLSRGSILFVIDVLIMFEKNYTFWFFGTVFRQFVLRVAKRYDEKLAELLHSPPPNKQSLYAIEPLFDNEYKIIEEVQPNREYLFRIKVFSDDLYAKFVAAFASCPERHKFRNLSFRVLRVNIKRIDPSNFSIKMDKIKYYFISPTVFKPMGYKWLDPIPTPQKIFRSVVKLWNTYINDKYSREDADSFANQTKVVGLNLKTAKPIDLGRNRKIIGTIGYLVMDISDLNNEARQLLKFSEFTNIGKNRTYGMGTIRIVSQRR